MFISATSKYTEPSGQKNSGFRKTKNGLITYPQSVGGITETLSNISA